MRRSFATLLALLCFGVYVLVYTPRVFAQAPERITIANAASTGTTLNKLGKLTGAPSTAVAAATTDTGGVIGIVVAGAGTTGSAVIQIAGTGPCVFDGPTTAGHYVQISGTSGADCHDSGASNPTSGQIIGRVLSTNGGGGTYNIVLFPAEINASAGSVSCANMPALTGDVTTSAGSCADAIANNAVTSAKQAVVNTRRTCAILVGADNASLALANADIAPQGRQCFISYAATVVEVEVAADGGTPSVIPAKNHAGSLSDFVSSALATAGSGGIACSNTGGTTGLDGTTTCSATLQNTSLAAGDYIETHSATAGGTAKRVSIFVTYMVN